MVILIIVKGYRYVNAFIIHIVSVHGVHVQNIWLTCSYLNCPLMCFAFWRQNLKIIKLLNCLCYTQQGNWWKTIKKTNSLMIEDCSNICSFYFWFNLNLANCLQSYQNFNTKWSFGVLKYNCEIIKFCCK